MHTGSCFCGSVRYEIRGDLGAAYYCHCSRCRKISGSAFSANAVVEPSQFTVTQGHEALKAHVNEEDVHRWFCKHCGSSLYVSQGDAMRLRLGSLDTPLPHPPAMHLYAGSKADWFCITDGLPQHIERP